MDRNQIIGWILIVGIVIGYITLNSSQEIQTIQRNEKSSFSSDSLKVQKKSNIVGSSGDNGIASSPTNDLLSSKEIKKVNFLSRLFNSINYLIWGDV